MRYFPNVDLMDLRMGYITTPKPVYKRISDKQFAELRKEAYQKMKSLEHTKRWQIKAKVFLFPFLYFAAYAILLWKGTHPIVFFTAYSFLGFFLILNFLNLIHDAVHGVIFSSPKWLNKVFIHFFDLLGANSYIWKIRHIRLHHAYPNIMDWDSDLEQSPLVKIFPQAPFRAIHKYQHLYLPFLYPLYLFNWLLVRDFRDFFNQNRIVRRVTKIPRIEYLKLFIFKAIFFSYLIVIPKFVLGVGWSAVFLGFIVMVLTASLFSLIVLLSPHANITSDFSQPDADGHLADTWFEHQLKCTNDVSNDNFFIRFFMGSFNYHIAHHLFPDIHHIYYPEIAPIIRNFAEKHQLPYRSHRLRESLMGHYFLLKRNAFNENIFEETM